MAKKSDPDVILRLADGVRKDDQFHQQQAEKRVALFLTIASISITFIVRGSVDSGVPFNDLMIGLLIILFVYGLETLQSVNWSRLRKDRNRQVADILWRKLSEVSTPTKEVCDIYLKEDVAFSKVPFACLRGSLPEFMYLSNSLLAVGITLSLFARFGTDSCIRIWVGSFVFIGIFTAQYLWWLIIRLRKSS